MTPKLSDDQRQALQEHGGIPVSVVDADTHDPTLEGYQDDGRQES